MIVKKSDRILVIIGPSGAGKSSVVQALSKLNILEVNPTWTTRSARRNEKLQSVEHIFVDKNEFEKLKKQDYFLETIKMFGLNFEYGLPKIKLSKNTLIPTIMLRAPLIPILTKYYPNYYVYQIEDSLDNISKRLKERELAGEALGSRLSDYNTEIQLGRKLANRVFTNNELSMVVMQIKKSLEVDFGL